MPPVKTGAVPLLLILLLAGFHFDAQASPAPAPLLQSPASGAVNVDPDPTLSWRWVDDLMVNGGFESGMSPGWSVSSEIPSIWGIVSSTTNHWAGATMPNTARATGQLIQSLDIPADAVSATLQWSERIVDMYPYSIIARLRVMLFQGGAYITTLEDAYGFEPPFASHTWVSRSADLLAYAGQSFQLVVQADSYDPRAYAAWWADVDGFSLSCEHASGPPEFQVLLGKNSVLRATNQVASTAGLSVIGPPLTPVTKYYWCVGAVRDGVTNYSATRSFTTGQRVLPRLKVLGLTNSNVQLSFPTHAGRNYTIEQRDGLNGMAGWYDVLSAGQGTGATMKVEVPLPYSDTAFWRLRVSP
jgi:hypothetical protein